MNTLNIIPEEHEPHSTSFSTSSSKYSDFENIVQYPNNKLSIIHENSEQKNFKRLGSKRAASSAAIPPRQAPPSSPSISNSNVISRSNSSSFNSNTAGPRCNSLRNNGGIQIKQISTLPFLRTNSKIHSDPGSQATATSVSFPTFKNSSIALEENLTENLDPEGVVIVNRSPEFYYHNAIQNRNTNLIIEDTSRPNSISRRNTKNEYNYIYGGRMKSFKKTKRRKGSFFSTASATKRLDPLHERIRDYESSISTLESKQASLKRSNKTYFLRKANVWRLGVFKKFKAKCKSWKTLLKKGIRERRIKRNRRSARGLCSEEINDLIQNDDPLLEKFREKRISRDQRRFSARFVGSLRRKLSIMSSGSFRRNMNNKAKHMQQDQAQQGFSSRPDNTVRLTAENIELFANGYKPVKDNLKKYMDQIDEGGNSMENIDLMEEIESGTELNHGSHSLNYSSSTRSSKSIHSDSSVSSSVYSDEILSPNYQAFEHNWNLYLKQLMQQKTLKHLRVLVSSNQSEDENIQQIRESAKEGNDLNTKRFSTLEEILPNYMKNYLSNEPISKVLSDTDNYEMNSYIEDMKIYTQALSQDENDLINFSSSTTSTAASSLSNRQDKSSEPKPNSDNEIGSSKGDFDTEIPGMDDVESLSSKTTIQSSNSSIKTNLHSESQYYSLVNTDDDDNDDISINNERLDEIIKNLERSNTTVIHKFSQNENSNSLSSSNSMKLTRINAAPINDIKKADSLTKIILSDEGSLINSSVTSFKKNNKAITLARKPSSIKNERRVASNNIIRFLSLRNAGFSDDDSDVELVKLKNKDGPRKIESVVELSRKSSSIASSIEITPYHTLKKSSSAASEIRSSLKVMNV